jgi:hypothetical protein
MMVSMEITTETIERVARIIDRAWWKAFGAFCERFVDSHLD